MIQLAVLEKRGYAPKLLTSRCSKDSTLGQNQELLPHYTILIGGHPVKSGEEGKVLDGETAILAVPQRTLVDINLVEAGGETRKTCFASVLDTVGDLKRHLSSQAAADFPWDDALVYDVHGEQLQDASLLSTAANFSTQRCRLNFARPPDAAGLSAAAGPLATLAPQWRAVQVPDDLAGLKQHLEAALQAALASWPGAGGAAADEQLETSSYDAVRRRLPSDSAPAPAPGPSPDLQRARQAFATAAADGASACPALGREAVALVDAVTAALEGTNAAAARQSAAAAECLAEGIAYLASRAPRERRHAAHAAHIRDAEAALDLHRDIRAGKVVAYKGSEKMVDMQRALNATQTVRAGPKEMDRARGDLDKLAAELADRAPGR